MPWRKDVAVRQQGGSVGSKSTFVGRPHAYLQERPCRQSGDRRHGLRRQQARKP